MTPIRATNVRAKITRAVILASGLFVLVSLSACGKDKGRPTCEEPQAYQSVVAGKRIVVPDGLKPLDEFKEMPVPKAETPPRPEGAGCIENPPAVGTGG